MKYVLASMALSALFVASAFAEKTTAPSAGFLSAFFGLDDSRQIRRAALPACRRLTGGDGMPAILSHEIDDGTLDADDFRVTTRSGKIGRVDCATLRPADEKGEKRTVLLIGEYGSAEDQPATVEIVGDLMSLEGGLNFRGAKTTVIPFEAGPALILAEAAPLESWSFGGPDNCPRDGVKSVVRATWAGGVTKPGGAEIDEQEMRLYRVDVRLPNGAVETITPLAVGDLNDNDNNHELCLGVAGEPLRVSFPAGSLTDPNEDLNPATTIEVSPHRSD